MQLDGAPTMPTARLDFKYGHQVAILEKQLSAITPELMPGSSPNFNHDYI
jgi:hypothetical protein